MDAETGRQVIAGRRAGGGRCGGAGGCGATPCPGRSRGAPGPRPNSAPLCTEANPGSSPTWGAEWGWRRESRAARPAGGALGLRARLSARQGLLGARESGLFGYRARLIVKQLRGRPSAGRAAKVGGGRTAGGGRRARAGLVVGVSVFFFKTPLGRAGDAFRPPGLAGDVRAAAAADAGLRAARSLQLVSSIVAEPVSHFATPLAAVPLAGCPIVPHPAPRDPRPGLAQRVGPRRRRRRRGVGGAGEGAGRARKLAGEVASCGSPRLAPGPGRETRGFTDPCGRRALLPPARAAVGNEEGIGSQPGAFPLPLRSSPSPNTLWASAVSGFSLSRASFLCLRTC